ncbi:hypothetical protein HD806DRAFT_492297 [Xylariaceae sp. AK1471]|nr:hypothetical protein HD806DRAFT_492297 [Xylariaceae sp. AK1471]
MAGTLRVPLLIAALFLLLGSFVPVQGRYHRPPGEEEYIPRKPRLLQRFVNTTPSSSSSSSTQFTSTSQLTSTSQSTSASFTTSLSSPPVTSNPPSTTDGITTAPPSTTTSDEAGGLFTFPPPKSVSTSTVSAKTATHTDVNGTPVPVLFGCFICPAGETGVILFGIPDVPSIYPPPPIPPFPGFPTIIIGSDLNPTTAPQESVTTTKTSSTSTSSTQYSHQNQRTYILGVIQDRTTGKYVTF